MRYLSINYDSLLSLARLFSSDQRLIILLFLFNHFFVWFAYSLVPQSRIAFLLVLALLFVEARVFTLRFFLFNVEVRSKSDP